MPVSKNATILCKLLKHNDQYKCFKCLSRISPDLLSHSRLVLQDLCSSSLFEGRDFAKFFSHDIRKVEDKEYHMAGKIAAMSILHDGPGIQFLQNTSASLC